MNYFTREDRRRFFRRMKKKRGLPWAEFNEQFIVQRPIEKKSLTSEKK